MRRSIWPVLLFLGLIALPASAHGFGRSRGAVEVRPSYYYVPTYSYYVPVGPRVVYPLPPVFVAPPITVTPYATPVVAPASVSVEPPLADTPRASVGESSS